MLLITVVFEWAKILGKVIHKKVDYKKIIALVRVLESQGLSYPLLTAQWRKYHGLCFLGEPPRNKLWQDNPFIVTRN